MYKIVILNLSRCETFLQTCKTLQIAYKECKRLIYNTILIPKCRAVGFSQTTNLRISIKTRLKTKISKFTNAFLVLGAGTNKFQATLTGKETVGPKIEGDSVCTLEIDCGELVFKHHPLFSKEHCLGERLCHLCDGLIKIRTPGDRLSGRLEALTNSRKHSMYMARSSGERLHTAAAAKLVTLLSFITNFILNYFFLPIVRETLHSC